MYLLSNINEPIAQKDLKLGVIVDEAEMKTDANYYRLSDQME